MSIQNDGGPAYPIPDHPVDNTSGNWLGHYQVTSDGMSVRDVLACHALQGLLAGGCRMSEAGKSCWIAADEALAARTEPSVIDLLRKQHAMMLSALKAIEPYLTSLDEASYYASLNGGKADAFDVVSRKVQDTLAKLR